MTRFEYASPGFLLKSNYTGKNSEFKIKIIHVVFYFVKCRRSIHFQTRFKLNSASISQLHLQQTKKPSPFQVSCGTLVMILYTIQPINAFHATGLFLYPLQASDNQRPVARNGLNNNIK